MSGRVIYFLFIDPNRFGSKIQTQLGSVARSDLEPRGLGQNDPP